MDALMSSAAPLAGVSADKGMLYMVGLPSFYYVVRNLLFPHMWSLFKYLFTTTVEVSSYDDAFDWIKGWLDANPQYRRQCSSSAFMLSPVARGLPPECLPTAL
eukprot:gene6069-5932_t